MRWPKKKSAPSCACLSLPKGHSNLVTRQRSLRLRRSPSGHKPQSQWPLQDAGPQDAPLTNFKGLGVSRSLLPTSSFRALVNGPGFPQTDMWDHTQCVVRALVPTVACNLCMCIIAKRLGSLHWLAHAARHRHFQDVFTSRRTVSSAEDR